MEHPKMVLVSFRVIPRLSKDGQLTHVTLRKTLQGKNNRLKTKSFHIPVDHIAEVIEALQISTSAQTHTTPHNG